MDNFSRAIRSMHEIQFPNTLHGKIMRKLAFLQFRTPFILIVTLLCTNIFVSGFQIWTHLSENESIEIMKSFSINFDWSWPSFLDIFSTFSDVFPITLIISFVLNILMILYLFYLMRSFKKLAVKNVL